MYGAAHGTDQEFDLSLDLSNSRQSLQSFQFVTCMVTAVRLFSSEARRHGLVRRVLRGAFGTNRRIQKLLETYTDEDPPRILKVEDAFSVTLGMFRLRRQHVLRFFRHVFTPLYNAIAPTTNVSIDTVIDGAKPCLMGSELAIRTYRGHMATAQERHGNHAVDPPPQGHLF